MHPRLNCLEQGDQGLLEAIRSGLGPALDLTLVPTPAIALSLVRTPILVLTLAPTPTLAVILILFLP